MAKFSRPRVINDETNDETFRQDGARGIQVVGGRWEVEI